MRNTPISNRLLNSLSSDGRRAIDRKLRAVSLPVGTPIFEAGIEPSYAYFLTSGVASVITDMAQGSVVDVELLGREALPGSLLLLGGLLQSTRCVMQVAGTGLQISFTELKHQFQTNPELHARILQHVQYKAFTLSQLSACNQLHAAEERFARLLLMVADRIGDTALPLTQEFMSVMLGTRRPTVSVIAANLQKAGLVAYHRGTLHILDRSGIERRACECYSALRNFHKELYADPVTVSYAKYVEDTARPSIPVV